MSQPSVGFMGAGRVARILVSGWVRAEVMPPRVVAFDPDSAVCAKLCALHDNVERGTAPGAAAQEVVFIAVHPPVMKEAAAALAPLLGEGSLVVSLSPKFTMTQLCGLLGGFQQIARVIPNAPSIVGRGYNPVAFAPALGPEARARLEELLNPLGAHPEVEEENLEAYALLAAMGPTYFWPQLYALSALGESFGLSPAATSETVKKMMCGTMTTMRESGLGLDEVMDLIPVKPMAEEVAAISAVYTTKLTALLEKIRP